ncbi:MAG: helix-turn-helix transcriptional regulator [Clostridiales bacterium]|nr:helix-turn-helix transcriptional regulator [Clostridiales bacterium]
MLNLNYESDSEKMCDFRKLPRPSASIAYLMSGSADFYVGNDTESSRLVHFETDDLIFVPYGSTYMSTWKGAEPSKPSKCYSIYFTFALPELCSSTHCVIQKISGLTELKDDFRFIIENVDYGLPKNDSVQLEVLARFYKICAKFMPLLNRREVSPDDAAILQTVEYIEHNYKKPLKVADLAKLCSLSESHYYARFKTAVGMTPIEYKTRVAISYAEQLLVSEPKLSIEEVSERTGFESSSYFRRVFHKLTGQSPRDYRKETRGRL